MLANGCGDAGLIRSHFIRHYCSNVYNLACVYIGLANCISSRKDALCSHRQSNTGGAGRIKDRVADHNVTLGYVSRVGGGNGVGEQVAKRNGSRTIVISIACKFFFD